jgi:UDP-N-acetylmuramyl tripeptide synthase
MVVMVLVITVVDLDNHHVSDCDGDVISCYDCGGDGEVTWRL